MCIDATAIAGGSSARTLVDVRGTRSLVSGLTGRRREGATSQFDPKRTFAATHSTDTDLDLHPSRMYISPPRLGRAPACYAAYPASWRRGVDFKLGTVANAARGQQGRARHEEQHGEKREGCGLIGDLRGLLDVSRPTAPSLRVPVAHGPSNGVPKLLDSGVSDYGTRTAMAPPADQAGVGELNFDLVSSPVGDGGAKLKRHSGEEGEKWPGEDEASIPHFGEQSLRCTAVFGLPIRPRRERRVRRGTLPRKCLCLRRRSSLRRETGEAQLAIVG